MLKPFLALISTALMSLSLSAQSYATWHTGDTSDVPGENVLPGIVLAGGGGDNDQAMQWMLSRAGGGDVVVIRASGSDGYNDYFYSELGVAVNSVRTIRFDSGLAAHDGYVINQIRNAECLFIAGGDQFDYYTYWKDTPVEDAINYLINEKRVPVGGTSAGMAILSRCYYAPSGSSLASGEALADPFHPSFELLGKDDFLNVPFTDNLITDTHYDQRQRAGRHVGFLARLAHANNARSFGIACNEYTAVAIDENGLARAFGDYPEYPEDFTYFLQANCQEEFLPEVIEAGVPLTWNRGQSAVKVFALPARPTGEGFFNLSDWISGEGGEWQNWYVQKGELFRVFDTGPDCAEVLNATPTAGGDESLSVFPNPVQNELRWLWRGNKKVKSIRVVNLFGQLVLTAEAGANTLNLEGLPAGSYFIHFHAEGKNITRRFIKS